MDILNSFSLEGKQILVTGASSGIGRGIAIACSQMGAKVVLTGRDKERLSQTLGKMKDNGHQIIMADLTKAEDIKRLVESLPMLDGLVQCSGIGSRVICKDLLQEDITSVMKVNFDGPVLLQAELLTKKKINKSASIIYIASRAYESPSIGNAIYSASKGAIVSYSKCLALELSPRQIRVNCICPGMIHTDLVTDTLGEDELQKLSIKYPLSRYGTVEDVANLAVYLLSDAASWMTGASIDICGGGEGLLV